MDCQRVIHDDITIDMIQRATCEEFGIPFIDMNSARRPPARARQVAMWLCRHLTTQSLPAIGRAFGNRDHTTIHHGITRIDELMETNPEFSERVTALRDRLEPLRASDGT
jgi:chromosomal replication initiator protein